MIATYKGKEFCCQICGKDRLVLRSMKKIDDTFEYSNGMYIKYVDKKECTKVVDNWVFAVYKDEYAYIYAVDTNINEFYVVVDTTTEYSEEFINVVLGGKRGRDVFSWCSVDVFTEYYSCNEYFNHREENKVYLSKRQAIEHVILLNGGELTKKVNI